MSIYEVTNLDTDEVELVGAAIYSDLYHYCPHVKIAALNPQEYIQVVTYLNGQYHSEQGPAVTLASGTNLWFIKDKLHNEHGPASIQGDGSKEWYINNEQLTEEQFNEYVRSGLTPAA